MDYENEYPDLSTEVDEIKDENEVVVPAEELQIDEPFYPGEKEDRDYLEIVKGWEVELSGSGMSQGEKLEAMGDTNISSVANADMNSTELEFDNDNLQEDANNGFKLEEQPEGRDELEVGGAVKAILTSDPINMNEVIREDNYEGGESMKRYSAYEEEEVKDIDVDLDEEISDEETGDIEVEDIPVAEEVEPIEAVGDTDSDITEEVLPVSDEEIPGLEIEDIRVQGGEVSEELEGELRKEVEAIELNNEANTGLFDGVEIYEDVNSTSGSEEVNIEGGSSENEIVEEMDPTEGQDPVMVGESAEPHYDSVLKRKVKVSDLFRV